jgi:hypothetical protein
LRKSRNPRTSGRTKGSVIGVLSLVSRYFSL